MNKSQFDLKPELVEYEGQVARINYDVEEKEITIEPTHEGEESGETRTVYMAYVTRLNQPLSYERIVSAIVEDGYPADKMQAVVNNYLLNPSDADITAAFNTMQDWRKMAKQIGRKITGITPENDDL